MKTEEDLIYNVLMWAKDKGIFDKATIPTQTGKFQEEVNELLSELEDFVKQGDNTEEVIMEMGDVVVTLVILAEMIGFDIMEALQAAYNKIAKRQGKMVNGIFVKSEDL